MTVNNLLGKQVRSIDKITLQCGRMAVDKQEISNEFNYSYVNSVAS